MKIFKRVAVALALVVVASFTPVAVAEADPVSPSCQDQSCNGQMPDQAGCTADAQTIDSFYADDEALVELRYSPSCDAAWARLSGPGQGSGSCNGWNDDDVVEIQGADWQSPGTDSYDNCLVGDQTWTAMIGFGWNVRACDVLRQPWASGEPDIGLGCTALH